MKNRLTLDSLNLTDAVLNKPNPCLPSVALPKGGAQPNGRAEGAAEGLTHLFGEPYASYEI